MTMTDPETLATIAFTVSTFSFGAVFIMTRTALKKRQLDIEHALRTTGYWSNETATGQQQRIAQLEQMLAGERRENADLLAKHSRSMGRIAGLEERIVEVQRQRDAARVPSGETGANADLRLTITDLRRTIAELEREAASFKHELAEGNDDNEAKRQRIRQLESLLQMEQARTGHGLNAVPLPVWAAQKIETLERQLRAPNAHQRNLCEGVALKYAREYRKRGDGDMNRAAVDMADLIAREIRSLD